MKLTSFRVKNFRSIDDSTWVDVNDITNIIGVNESGKSNILLALWKLNPATDDGKINLLADLPRERYAELKDSCQKMDFIETYWDLSEDEGLLEKLVEYGPFEEEEFYTLHFGRYYSGRYFFNFPNLNIQEKRPSKKIQAALHQFLDSFSKDNIPEELPAEQREALISCVKKLSSNIAKTETLTKEAAINLYNELSAFSEVNYGDSFDTLLDICETEKTILTKKDIIYSGDFFSKTLKPAIPHFVYYSNYGNLDSEIYLPTVISDMNRTDLTGTTAAKVRTLRILFSFINLKPQEILELGKDIMLDGYGNPVSNPSNEQLKDFSAKKNERTVLLDSASAKLTAKFRDWWKQGTYDFLLRADGYSFKIWVSDEKRPAKVDLESRSTGLQWFLSFYLTFLVETAETLSNTILLLDEAGLSLHPLAQKDLVHFFQSLAENNQIIHTTHSPFLVDTDNIDNVKLAYVDDSGHTVLSDDLRATQDPKHSTSIYAVHAALGLRVSDILLQGCMPIIVEGVSDQYYLNAIKLFLIRNKKLAPQKEIIFIPVGGVKSIRPVASLMSPGNDGLPYIVVDSDKSGQDYKKALLKELYAGSEKKIIEIKDVSDLNDSEIEDIIPFRCLEQGITRLFRDIEDDFIPDQNMPLIPQLESFAQKYNIQLPKGYKVPLAKGAKRKIIDTNKTDAIVSVWVNLFKKFK
ncbi:AAA ATPase domain protein [Selenomonas sp. FOBRC9]|uniref:AAA family ATPase n=1 Tax=Selenomonas sp. FOBRC9 TaxID=936573 RepID=UPI00027A3DBD|nr:AAA family ATPase [Selenomonas sp. FOBRC9]EJP28316.1 AAA ATPase domain protein [Selenomonas sp. FOBRC9]